MDRNSHISFMLLNEIILLNDVYFEAGSNAINDYNGMVLLSKEQGNLIDWCLQYKEEEKGVVFIFVTRVGGWLGFASLGFNGDGEASSTFHRVDDKNRQIEFNDSHEYREAFETYLEDLAFEQQQLASGIESFLEGRAEQGK